MNEEELSAISAFEHDLQLCGQTLVYSHDYARLHFVVQAYGLTWDVWPTTGRWMRRGKFKDARQGLPGFWLSLRHAGDQWRAETDATPVLAAAAAARAPTCQPSEAERVYQAAVEAERAAAAHEAILTRLKDIENRLGAIERTKPAETVTPEKARQEGRAGQGGEEQGTHHREGAMRVHSAAHAVALVEALREWTKARGLHGTHDALYTALAQLRGIVR